MMTAFHCLRWLVPTLVLLLPAAGAFAQPQTAQKGYEPKPYQGFQMIEGTLKQGDRSMPIANGRLRGDQISFRAGGIEYSGRVSGERIEGTLRGSSSGSWSAAKRNDNPVSSPTAR